MPVHPSSIVRLGRMHRHCALPVVAHENGSYMRCCLILLMHRVASQFYHNGRRALGIYVRQELCTT